MTDETKAGMPERIWAWLNGGTFWTDDPNHSGISKKTEYVLASRLHAAEKVIEVAERGLNDATKELHLRIPPHLTLPCSPYDAIRSITAYRESK